MSGLKYKGKVAIVTGGTGNLGRVIVSRFAQRGIKVYVPVLSLTEFKKIFEETTELSSLPKLRLCYGIPCDANDKNEVVEFCSNVYNAEKKIDYLVNVIGGFHPKTNLTDMKEELIIDQLKLNFFSAFYFTQSCVNYMMKNNFGRIISFAAKPAIELTAGKFAYSLSKYAVLSLMNTYADELKLYDITFNTIIPDIIDTPENRRSMPDRDHSKFVKPEHIAGICEFLIGQEASNINGNVIKIFGNA